MLQKNLEFIGFILYITETVILYECRNGGGENMSNNWSQYVQTTQELYKSRSLRFHDGNKDLWLSAIGAKDGMNILEVGCAGGLFCHRITTYLPDVKITGLDFDSGHIAWARKKPQKQGLTAPL